MSLIFALYTEYYNNMDNKKLLGKRIKQIRKSHGYTQEQFSEKIGLETSSLSGIESGRFFPSLHTLDKMASVLNLELIDFFKFPPDILPEDLDDEIVRVYKKLDRNSKEVIFRMLSAAV